MQLRKIISGGQTGADQAGLIAARTLGIATGGTAPQNYRTERGSEKWLADYGLVESAYYDFAPRTRRNAHDADVTIWFGNIGSPGYWCTSKACDQHKKLFIINPLPEDFKLMCDTYEVINIAGNRYSKNPNTLQLVFTAFGSIGLVEVSPEDLKLLKGTI